MKAVPHCRTFHGYNKLAPKVHRNYLTNLTAWAAADPYRKYL